MYRNSIFRYRMFCTLNAKGRFYIFLHFYCIGSRKIQQQFTFFYYLYFRVTLIYKRHNQSNIHRKISLKCNNSKIKSDHNQLKQ